MDGSLVFGGYDYAKVQGKKYSKTFGSRNLCETGMMVHVTDIQLNFANGTNSSITPGQSLNTCIVPDYPAAMSLPKNPFFSNFERLTSTANIGQSVGINYGGALYLPDAVYNGDLSITIASCLTIRIPNNQLVLPELILDQNGNEQFNSSNMEDAGSFALFQANPTGRVHLLAIRNPSCEAGVLPNSTSKPGNSTTCGPGNSTTCGNPKSPKIAGENPQSGLSISAMIGAIIGSCAAAALGIGLVFFLIRSRQRRKKAVSNPLLLCSDGKDDSPPHEMVAYSPKQEVRAGVVGAEMPVPWTPLPPTELPATPL